jgi:peptidoglycan hydrolase CwlO-like protein
MNKKNRLKKITIAIFCVFIILLMAKLLCNEFNGISGRIWDLESKINGVESEVSDIQSKLSPLKWRIEP